MSSTHTPGEESPDDDDIFPFIVDETTDRGQHIFCENLLLNLFEPIGYFLEDADATDEDHEEYVRGLIMKF